MASVKDSNKYVEFDEFVDYQLGKTRDGVKWTDVFTAIVGAAVLILGYLLLFVLADHWFFDGGVPRSVRIAAFAVVLVLACVWIVVKGIWPFFRRVSDLYAARMLEGAEPSLRGHLLGLIDSRRAGRVPSEEIRRVLEKRSATTLSSVDVDAALDRGNLMRVSYTLLGVVLAMCAYVIFSPKDIGPSIVRAMIPGSSVGVATRTEILEVKPQDTTILAGERLDVSVRIRGERPDKVWLFYSTRDRRFVNEPLELRLVDEPTRRYATTLIGDGTRGLRQDLTYHITAGDAQTQTFTVHVGQPPAAAIESIALEPPAYTKRPPRTLAGPPIEALEGTHVTLNARANRPLEAATLQLADSSDFQRVTREVPLTLSDDGMTASGEWTLKLRDDGSSPKFIRIGCRDTDGSPNPNPIVYPISIHADQRPKITLHDPKSDLERPANSVVPLLISAIDPDFELREITLHIAKGNEDLPGRTVVWEGEAPSASLRHEWKLEDLALKPGDTLTYYLQARDNREPSAGRRNSPKLNIRITEAVSPEEAQKQLAEDVKRQEEAQAAAPPQAPGGVGEPPPPEPAENTPPKERDQQNTGDAPDQQPNSAGEKTDDNTTENREQTPDRQQQEPSEPVKNDGSADDEAIRKILEHQREQNGGQPEGQQQPNGKGGQNAGEKQGGANQGESSSEGQSSPDSKSHSGGGRSGQDGADSRPGDANGDPSSENDAMPSDGPTGKPGSPDPSAQPADQGAADSNPMPQDPGQASDGQTTGGETAGQDSTGQAPDGAEQGDGGMNSPDGGAASDGQPSPEPGEGGAQPDNNDATPSDAPDGSAGEPAGAQHPQGDQSESAEGAGGNGADGQKGEDPAGGQGNDPTSSDQKPGPPESSGTGADPSKPPGEMQPAPGENTGQSNQPAREQLPSGDNPNPGEGSTDQRSPRPEAGEQGAGAPNSTGQTDNATGNGTKTSGQGPGNTPDPADQSNNTNGQAGQGESAQQPTGTGQPQGAAGEQGPSPSESTPSEKSPGEGGASGSQPQGAGQPQKSGGGEQSGGGQSGQSPTGEGQSGMGQSGQGQSGQGQSGQGQSGQGQSGQGQSGQGQSGKGSDSSGQSGSASSAGGSGSSPTGGNGSGSGGQGGMTPAEGGPPPSAPNEPNDDNAREAANLVLKRLDESLDRGEVDPELLKELGWTEDDMRKFADRMRSNLSPPTGEESARDRAHRLEFEHMLENMSFQAEGDIREGGTGRVERVEGVGTVKPAVPTEYRDAYDRFTRSVSGLEKSGEPEQGSPRK